MMGEGMPWNIIFIFIILGFILGVNSSRREHQEELQDEEKT